MPVCAALSNGIAVREWSSELGLCSDGICRTLRTKEEDLGTLRHTVIVAIVAAVVTTFSSSTFGDAAVSSAGADPRVRWAAAPVPLPDFRLTDAEGRAFGLADLRGRPALLFFGFTNCRNVCPATIQVLRQVQRSLRGESSALVNVFVSVDGSRDTPAVMRAYLEPYSPDVIGLTGEPADVRVLADRLSAVFFKGMPTDAHGAYDVEHTSQVYLVDAQGRLRATFYAAGADAISAAAQKVLRETS
jgi:protein SCO1